MITDDLWILHKINGVQKRAKKGPKIALFDPFLTPFWAPF